MALLFMLPPSVGSARARARGELIERSLGAVFGEDVDVRVATDYAELERAALSGDAALVWAPAAVCAHLEDAARAIFKVVRGGRSTYRSALVTRAAGGVAMERMNGARAAWVDRLSIGGYLLVAHHLRERGLDPDRTFAEQRFVGTHPEALRAVLEGNADVAAVSVLGPDESHVLGALQLHAGAAASARLVPLAVTDAAPTDALVFTRALPSAQVGAMIDKLFAGEAEPASGGRGPSSLGVAMEIEGFERAQPGEYLALRPLFAATRRM